MENGCAVSLLSAGSDWFSENQLILWICLGVVGLAILGVCIAALVVSHRNGKFLQSSNLKLSAKLAYDSDTMEEYLEISIFNHNLRDVSLKDFGLRYKDQTVSLISEFAERRLSKSHSVEVLTGSSITYKLNPERVEKFVVSHNFNAQSIDPIYIYAVDSSGKESLHKESSLSRVFNSRQKARILIAKSKIHKERIEAYKLSHDGNEPLTEGIYRSFHRKEVKIPDLIRRTQEQMKSDKSLSSATASTTNYSPAVTSIHVNEAPQPQSPRRMDTRDMKVTYLNLEPLKSVEETEKESGKKE